MAEEKQSAKRQRELEGPVEEDIQDEKRYKSCNPALSSNVILQGEQQEEEVSSQDLLALLTTLQQELSDPLPGPDPEEAGPYHQTVGSAAPECSPSSNSSVVSKEDEEDEEKERMIRHLLEASDDELGIPNRVDSGDEDFNAPFDLLHNPFSLCDGLWELEDEAANYYTLLQAELFM